MKKSILITVCLALAWPIFSQKTKAEKPLADRTTFDLSEAIAANLVSMTADGPGGYQNLKLTFKNQRTRSIRLQIQQGQLFLPNDAGQQTLVVAEAQTLALGSKTPAEILLKTFCTESNDASPTGGMGFTVGSLATENLRKLLDFLSKNGKMDSPAAQSAVWAVAGGGFHVAGIGDDALTKFVCELLKTNRPGYKIKYETRDSPGERAFAGKALVVDGNYTYFLEKSDKLSIALFDDADQLIKQLSKDKPVTAGEHRSSLHLEVKGLKQGKYVLKITTASGEVIKAEPLEF